MILMKLLIFFCIVTLTIKLHFILQSHYHDRKKYCTITVKKGNDKQFRGN